ncbi:MAG: hypothetical protein IT436_11075 [Phycisphaerales bacterium]|nr:hypothetical protein [Phycisphaerales bacterium]
MSGRPNRPLFELLRDSAREAPARPIPPLKIDAPIPPRPVREDAAPARAAAARQYIPVSQNAIYIGIAVGLVLLVITYAAGFTVGKNRAGADYRQRLSTQTPAPGVSEPPISAPGGPTSSNQPANRTQNPPAADPGRAPRPSTPVMVPSADGRILSSQGNLAADPRQPGLNYLSLAILNAQDTQAAIAFLSQNGLETIGVPLVDPKASKGNNPPLYQLVAVQGITSAEYRDRAPARATLEEAVERLGRAWQKDFKGTSNFAKHGWAKLD